MSRRMTPPRKEGLVGWGAAAVCELDSGLGTRSTKLYTIDNVNDKKLYDNAPWRIMSVTIKNMTYE